MRERIVAGNWKLHGDRAFARHLLDEVVASRPQGVRLAIFPPMPYLGELADRYGYGPFYLEGAPERTLIGRAAERLAAAGDE